MAHGTSPRQWEGWAGQASWSRGDPGGRQAIQGRDYLGSSQTHDFGSGGWSREGRQASQQQSKKQASSGKEEEEAGNNEDSDPSPSPSHDSSSDDEDKWCCNRQSRKGKGHGWYRCNTVNDESATECQRCSMPRYDYDNEFEGPDPRLTAGRPDDNSGQQIPPTVRVEHFIDGAAKCNDGEEEWDSQDVWLDTA
jgi:hypothetical protein